MDLPVFCLDCGMFILLGLIVAVLVVLTGVFLTSTLLVLGNALCVTWSARRRKRTDTT